MLMQNDLLSHKGRIKQRNVLNCFPWFVVSGRFGAIPERGKVWHKHYGGDK